MRKWTRSSADYTCRYMGAFDITLAQYKLNVLPAKFTDAVRFLELVIKLDFILYGDNSAVTEADRRLYLRLKQGYDP